VAEDTDDKVDGVASPAAEVEFATEEDSMMGSAHGEAKESF
jgi:hypothetical protein